MEVHSGRLSEIPALGGRWSVTLGTFDGVHLGHQAICTEAQTIAASHGYDGVVVTTFGQHPRAILTPDRRPRLLTTMEERLPLLAATGVDHLVVLEFDADLQSMEYDAFVRDVLMKTLGMAHFVLGHDVHFGRERGGNYRTVADLAEVEGFGLSQVASVRHEGEPISSTRIRDALASGDMDGTVAMLGHPFPVSGRVVEGRGVGRTLGFPTANLELLDAAKHLPPHGVYAAWAQVDDDGAWQEAVVNVGERPTFETAGALTVEVHLLDTSPDLYGKLLRLAFGPQLRGERRFESQEALVEQIGHDVQEARVRLSQIEGYGRPSRLDDLSGG